jgi:sugar lactone lactonase YvrE
MRMAYSVLFFAVMALAGCGSSTSSQTLTSGSTYETSAPNAVSTIAGTAGTAGSTDATGTSALFDQPNGIIASPDGKTLYVADYGNSTIRAIVLATNVVTTIAGSAGVTGTADGTGSAARFNGPHLLTTDGTNLYVPDFNNNSIRQIVIATGAVTTLAGSTTGIAGAVDATGTAARFNGPAGITITPDGTTLYVTDYNNSVVRKVVVATGSVTTVQTSAAFGHPAGIICDAAGTNLYLTDLTANTINKLVIASGVVSTLAGSTENYGSADGIGSQASFYTPNGITLLGSNLYVTDTSDDIIRKVTISTGVVTTVAGSAGVVGAANGVGIAAGFYGPLGITTDGTSLFVADSGNKTIREIK